MCMANDSFRLKGRLTLSLKLCVHVISLISLDYSVCSCYMICTQTSCAYQNMSTLCWLFHMIISHSLYKSIDIYIANQIKILSLDFKPCSALQEVANMTLCLKYCVHVI